MTADTTAPVVPSGGTQSLAGSPTYDAYANTQMGRLSRIVALHAGVSEPSTSQRLAERLAESTPAWPASRSSGSGPWSRTSLWPVWVGRCPPTCRR